MISTLANLQLVSDFGGFLGLVKLFGMLVGWLWITLGIILQFHPGHDYPRLIPVAFFFTGVSTILVTNRVWIPNYPESVLVTLVGYGIQALVGVVSMIWLLRIFPDQYECTN